MLKSFIVLSSLYLSTNQHKKYIIDIINRWFESQHYFISFSSDANVKLKGIIRCCCRKWLSLTLKRSKFRMSNFYHHLHNIGNGNICNTLREIINNPQSTSSPSINRQQALSSSDVSEQPSSPNTTPSNDLLIASTTSLSTDNNGTTKAQLTLAIERHAKRKVQSTKASYNTRVSTKRTRRT